MNNYPALRNLLLSIYSVVVGLEKEDEAFIRVSSSDGQRPLIEQELNELFIDPEAPWMDLVENDEYVVYPADDLNDAKEYIVERLWGNVFPDKETP